MTIAARLPWSWDAAAASIDSTGVDRQLMVSSTLVIGWLRSMRLKNGQATACTFLL
jgi:hypothetical protein